MDATPTTTLKPIVTPDVQNPNLMESVEKMIAELIESQVQMDPVMADIINEHIDELLMYEVSI